MNYIINGLKCLNPFQKTPTVQINISTLPNEILFTILQFLPPQNVLLKISLTNKNFYKISSHEYFKFEMMKIYKFPKDSVNPHKIPSKNLFEMCETEKINSYLKYAYNFLSISNFEKAKNCLDKAYSIIKKSENIKTHLFSNGFSHKLLNYYSEIGDFEKICEIICIKPNDKTKNHDTFFIDEYFIGKACISYKRPLEPSMTIKTLTHFFEKFEIFDKKELASKNLQKIENFLNNIALRLLEKLLYKATIKKSKFYYYDFLPILNIIEFFQRTRKYQTVYNITEKLLKIIKTEKIYFSNRLYRHYCDKNKKYKEVVIIFDIRLPKNGESYEILNEINAMARKTEYPHLLEILKEFLPKKLQQFSLCYETEKIKPYFKNIDSFISNSNFKEAKNCLDKAYLIIEKSKNIKTHLLSEGFSHKLLNYYSEIGDFEKICEIICIKPNDKTQNNNTFFIDEYFIGKGYIPYEFMTKLSMTIKTLTHFFEKFKIFDKKELTSENLQKIEKFLNNVALKLLEHIKFQVIKKSILYYYDFLPILNIIEFFQKTRKYQTTYNITEKLLEIIKKEKIDFSDKVYWSYCDKIKKNKTVIIFDIKLPKNWESYEILNEINAMARKTKHPPFLLKILKEILSQKLELFKKLKNQQI
jgi:hypothetical protein